MHNLNTHDDIFHALAAVWHISKNGDSATTVKQASFVKKICSRLDKLKNNMPAKFESSESEKLGLKLGLSSLYKVYLLPGSETLTSINDKLDSIDLYFAMDSIVAGINKAFIKFLKVDYLLDSDLKNKQNAQAWLDKHSDMYTYLNKLNDVLVELNPSLSIITRDRHNIEAERSFLHGVLYKRTPADIDWYLQTKIFKKDVTYNNYEETYIQHAAANFILSQCSRNTNNKDLVAYWVISPFTTNKVLNELGCASKTREECIGLGLEILGECNDSSKTTKSIKNKNMSEKLRILIDVWLEPCATKDVNLVNNDTVYVI